MYEDFQKNEISRRSYVKIFGRSKKKFGSWEYDVVPIALLLHPLRNPTYPTITDRYLIITGRPLLLLMKRSVLVCWAYIGRKTVRVRVT